MKTLTFDTLEEWMLARRCRITGSRADDIAEKKTGSGKKIGFYELVAERISLPPDNERPEDRGQRLEPEAIDRFVAKTGKEVSRELVIWTRDDNANIAVSPDGFVEGKKGEIKEAIEVKCLASARHIEAYLTKEVPKEYAGQVRQYFVVNPKLQKVHLCFYDPRLKVCDFFVLEVERKDVEDEIEAQLEHERKVLAEVDEIVKKLIEF